MCVCTLPEAAEQLDAHTDGVHDVCDGDEAEEACDDGWVEVLPHRRVRVHIRHDNLRTAQRTRCQSNTLIRISGHILWETVPPTCMQK